MPPTPPQPKTDKSFVRALLSALQSPNPAQAIYELLRGADLRKLAELLASIASAFKPMLQALLSDTTRDHRIDIYRTASRQLAKVIPECNQEDLALWLEHRAEDTQPANQDDKFAIQRVHNTLTKRGISIAIRLNYAKIDRGQHEEKIIGWVVSQNGVQEVTVARPVTLDYIPDYIRAQLGRGEREAHVDIIS